MQVRGSAEDAAPDDPAPTGTRYDPVDDDLRRSTIDGVKWNFLATLANLVGRLAFTFLLARLLGPDSFGVFAVAAVYIAFVVVFLDQGFGVALVQKERLEEHDVGTVAWLNLATGVLLTAVTVVLAPAVADFFATPELTALLRVLSVTLLLRSVLLVPLSLIRRELRFRTLALAETVGVLVGGVAGVLAALVGADYWSMAVQTIVMNVVTGVWVLLAVGRTSWRPAWSTVRQVWVFSSHVLLSSLVVFLGNNADNLLVARYEGATQLAFYALAFRLLRLPVQMTASVVNGVALPVLSRLQSDDVRSAAWFQQATQGLAVLTFPAFALLAVGAQDGVRSVFGEQWDAAAAPLQAMALAGPPLVVRMLFGPLATARARTGLVLTWSVITVGLQLLGFAVGLALGGMVGVAVSLAVVQYVTWGPQMFHALPRLLGTSAGAYFRCLVPPTAASLLAAAVWWAVQEAQQSLYGGPLLLQVAISAVAALAAYVGLVRLAWPRVHAETVSLAREMVRRRTEA